MKLKTINTVVAIAAIALTSCELSSTDITNEVGPTTISFRDIPEPLSRVVNNNFENGDKAMFDAYTTSGELFADNYTYVYSDGVFSSTSPISYPSSGEDLSFIASYPATKYLGKSFTYNVTADQSNPNSYEGNDLLIARIEATTKAQPSINFNHVMSCVELTIENGSSFSDLKIHAKTQVSCNTETMTFTATGSEVAITPEALGGNKYRVLIAPQTIDAGVDFITATLNGVDYTWGAEKQGVLAAGKKYSINCTLSEHKVVIAPVDVYRSGWAELPNEIKKSGDYFYAHHTVTLNGKTARNFSACYSDNYTSPVWVAGPYHKCYCFGSGDRKNNYREDPDIDCYQVETLGDPYNRGHMIASSDRLGNQELNNQAFYLSNIGPQLISGFNSGGGVWNNYEDAIQGWYQSRTDTLYVVNGCHWENTNKVVSGTTVPTHYYKALLRCKQANSKKFVKDCSRSELECVVIYLEHKSQAGVQPSSKHMISVEALEKKTGFKFFTNVPNAPKDTFNANDWL